MPDAPVADVRTILSDSWTIPAGLSAADLQQAREALSRVAATPGSVRFDSGDTSARAGVTPAATTTSVVRSDFDLDLAAAVRAPFAPLPQRTLGPFVDAAGVQKWIDLFPIVRKTTLASSTTGVLAELIAATAPPAQLGAGSLWLKTSALGISGAGFIGFAFSGAKVLVEGTLQTTADTVTIAPGNKLRLEITPVAKSGTAGVSGIGADAGATALKLPAHLTLEFDAGGISVTAFADVSVSVYGTSLTLTRAATAPQHVVAGSEFVVLPCTPSAPAFTVSRCLSTDIVLDGSAPIAVPSGWAFPIVTDPAQVAAAPAGAGAALIALGNGLTLTGPDASQALPLVKTQLLVAPGTIVITGVFGAAASRRFALWDAPPAAALVVPVPSRAASDLRLRVRRWAAFVATVSPAAEVLIEEVRIDANVDRPLGADGRRIPLGFDSGLAGFVHDPNGERIAVLGTAPNSTLAAGPVALENALLRCGPVRELFLIGKRAGPRITGSLGLAIDIITLLPTLPDPYAASFDGVRGGESPSRLFASVTWTSGEPALSFRTTTGIPGALADPALLEARASGAFVLLDLSSAADQFGVQLLAQRAAAGPTVRGLSLVAPETDVAIFALPGISWEPVVDDRTNDWYAASSNDDGPPARLLARSVSLVPVEPRVALPAFISDAADNDVVGEFTLPFGLIASLTADATHSPGSARPTFALVPGKFSQARAAALQIAIRAGTAALPGAPPGATAGLPGSATTAAGVPLTQPTTVFGAEILGANEIVNGVFDPLSAATFFDQQFAAGQAFAEIPVGRIDISGYGTSMFSDWRIPDITFTGVVRSRFDVLVGRTAYELVQIQSVIVPWSVRITRTIIFDRFDSGLVVRHDTGWKATDDARFELLHPDQIISGGMDRLQNIVSIEPSGGAPITFVSPDVADPNPAAPPGSHRTITFVPVLFDADLVFATDVSGIANGKISRTGAASRITGYVQETVGKSASALEIVLLMQIAKTRGVSIDGQIGAIVNVGSAASSADPKFTLNLSSFAADVTEGNVAGQTYPGVAVALRGVPRLPRDGAWSIARRAASARAPSAVDPAAPIPLVRAVPASSVPEWRLLDPSDALSVANPATFYGLLQTAGTSKTLFEHLIIDPAGRELGVDPAHVPNLADVGALLGATNLFPDLENVLSIPAATANALKLAGDGLSKTFTWPITDPDREIFKLAIVRLVLSYRAKDGSPTQATLVLDPLGSPRFALSLDGLTFAAYIDGISADPLLQIHGNFSADDTGKPGFNSIDVDYGSALSLVKSIISGLSELVKDLGGDVALDVGFSGSQLTVHQGFVLPTIPLGFGEIRDVGIDLGLSIDIPTSARFNVGIGGKREAGDDTGLKLKPFTWIVDPLTGNGALSLGVVNGDIAVYIEAGIGAALAIDLVIASGSASITLELAISTDQKPFVLAITLVGQAEVDVLGGLASASITLAAGIALHPDFPAGSVLPDGVDLTAMVAVGIHLSICWVISVDFDGSWQFSQHIPLHL